MKLLKYTIPVVAALFSSCAGIYYKEVPENVAHASIESEKTGKVLGMSVGDTMIVEINEQPIDTMWKGAGEERRIPVGQNTVLAKVSNGSLTTALGHLGFNAKPGFHYFIGNYSQAGNYVFFIKEAHTGKFITKKSVQKSMVPPSSSYTPIFIPVPAG